MEVRQMNIDEILTKYVKKEDWSNVGYMLAILMSEQYKAGHADGLKEGTADTGVAEYELGYSHGYEAGMDCANIIEDICMGQ
jgi:hypothetical protein